MSRDFRQLVERQIGKAIAHGQLRGLDGEGRPLPDRSGEAATDMATRVAFSLMAEAGALPEEFRAKKLLEPARQPYGEAESDGERRLTMALIANLEQRYNIAVEVRRRMMKP